MLIFMTSFPKEINVKPMRFHYLTALMWNGWCLADWAVEYRMTGTNLGVE